MKRLTVFVLVFLLALFALTPLSGAVSTFVDRTVKIYVDGELIEDTPVIMHEHSVYVPLRFVGYQLNADVEWDSNTRSVHISSAKSQPVLKTVIIEPSPLNSKPVNITGPNDFTKMVNDALNILETKAPDKYNMVTSFTKEIWALKVSLTSKGMAYANIFFGATLIDWDRFNSWANEGRLTPSQKSIALAGILVHEAYHVYAYQKGLIGNTNGLSSIEGEVLAHAVQRQTLKALGAPQKLMDVTSIDRVIDTNYYTMQ